MPIDPAEFAAAFHEFIESYNRLVPPAMQPFREALTAHLGTDPSGLPSVTKQLHPSELPNLQLAMDALQADAAAAGREWGVLGLPGEVRHMAGMSLVSIITGGVWGRPLAPTPVEYMTVPISVDEVMACVQLAVYLADHEGAPVVLLVAAGMEHGPRQGLAVEALAVEQETATAFLDVVSLRMLELNVYRGKVLTFSFTQYGTFGLEFTSVPQVERDDVILPEEDLAAIERHTVGIAAQASALLAAGRHLKRGLLLYGPPGTGKTLSVMYLCNRLEGRTVVLLTGGASGALGQATAIARSLQPAMVVLEDVDLVAMERTMPGFGSNPLLFQLLNEMDGLKGEADVVFVLTTNRVELLEPALAARPGRIDQAVEVKLPDAQSRQRLFERYLRGVPNSIESLGTFVAATEGVSAAFIKELIRRAVLDAALEAGEGDGAGAGAPTVTAAHVDSALSDLLVHSAPLTRAILGAAHEH